MANYEPFEQHDMDVPGIPGLVATLVKVGGRQPGVYVVMIALCQQLGDIDISSQVAKLREDHEFDGALREIPYKHPKVGMRTVVGIRRYKAGDWIRGINPKKTKPEYADRLTEIGKLITGVTDRAVFGKVASHLDPAPASTLTATPDTAADEAEPEVIEGARLTFKGEFQFTCEHGTTYLIIIDDSGKPRIVPGKESEA